MSALQDDNYWKILDAALELDVKKGHLKWTLSDLSRKSGVTRSLIYYYFGRAKVDILNVAIKLIGTELVGLTKERDQLWAEGKFTDSLVMARSVLIKAPYLSIFISEHIGRDNDIGKIIRDIQVQFLEKVRKYLKINDDAKVRAIFGIYWGLLFAPMQGDETYRLALKILPGLR